MIRIKDRPTDRPDSISGATGSTDEKARWILERETAFAMLDEPATAAAELRHDPYDFAFVEHALPERLKRNGLADAPQPADGKCHRPLQQGVRASRHSAQIITVLHGFAREWPHERGRLRVLRGTDRNDYPFEFAAEFGRMLMFRLGDDL